MRHDDRGGLCLSVPSPRMWCSLYQALLLHNIRIRRIEATISWVDEGIVLMFYMQTRQISLHGMGRSIWPDDESRDGCKARPVRM